MATKAERELEALRRLRAQQRPSGPLRDISDPMDHLKFLERQQLMDDQSDRAYRSFRILCRRRKPVALGTPTKRTPPRSQARQLPGYVTKGSEDDLHFKTEAEYRAWAHRIMRGLRRV
jgi:hypothetical protein